MRWLGCVVRRLPAAWLPEQALLRYRAIPDTLWADTLAAYPFLTWRTPERQARLRALATLFLARKQFTPMPGVTLTDAMAVAIAAQACLPVLQWGLTPYSGFVSIVVHPDQVIARREIVDDAGVVHHYEEVLAGEAQHDGPIMLSWRDVDMGADHPEGYNVVIHEFVHALDMSNGDADGLPPLPARIQQGHWLDTLWQAFDRHRDALAHGDATWLDPYAAEQGLTEFLPVVCEAFFVAPHRLAEAHPDVYALMCTYFGEDPTRHAPAPPQPSSLGATAHPTQ